MADTNRNALAELAETLKRRIECHGYVYDIHRQEDITTQRIIAELAKIQEEEAALFSMENLTSDEARRILHQREGNCILKCRAIAEENLA